MAFTRQHYQAIASIIRAELTPHGIINSDHTNLPLTRLAENLAEYFAKDNPRFDHKKFLSACGTHFYTI